MMVGLYSAASGMVAQQNAIDAISHNLANVNTTGYKSSQLVFSDMLALDVNVLNGGVLAGSQLGAGVMSAGTYTAWQDGSFSETGNPLDTAIIGNGLIPVRRPDGRIGYTRSGQFQVDANGRLNIQGLLVQPPVTIPAGTSAQDITVKPDGSVDVKTPLGTQTVGQLQLATFGNPSGLSRLGNGLYEETPASGGATVARPGSRGVGTFQAGGYEASNVDISREMVALIEAQRAFETNAKIVSTMDQMAQAANGMMRA